MRESNIKRIGTAFLAVLVCMSTACTTLRPVAVDPAGDRIRAEIKVGDTVRVLSRDGTTHRFRVTAVGTSSLAGDAAKMSPAGAEVVGSKVELLYQDMQQIDVQRISGGKTTGIIAAVVLVAVIGIASGGGSHQAGYGSR